jgi:hypothetical protein
VIALCDVLMRCNWVKRALFPADRVALVNQAVNAFKRHLPDASSVNLVTERDAEGRVFVSTYPTMMGLIDETRDGERRFGIFPFEKVEDGRAGWRRGGSAGSVIAANVRAIGQSRNGYDDLNSLNETLQCAFACLAQEHRRRRCDG